MTKSPFPNPLTMGVGEGQSEGPLPRMAKVAPREGGHSALATPCLRISPRRLAVVKGVLIQPWGLILKIFKHGIVNGIGYVRISMLLI